METDKKRLWLEIGRESVWGRRGLGKANPIWVCLAFFLLSGDFEGDRVAAVTCLRIYLSVYLWVLTSILANDLSDLSRDVVAGKQRWIGSVPYPGNWAIVISLSLAGLGVIVFSQSPAGAGWAYLGATVLGLGYSLRPFRAKERGAWGLFIYASSCTLGYVLFPWVWLKATWPVLLVLSPAVFLDKWVNLHFHEIQDHETDAKKGIGTYVVRAGAQKARSWLLRMAVLAVVSAAALLIFGLIRLRETRTLMMLAMGGVFALGGGYVLWERRRSSRPSPLVQDLPWTYLASTLTVFRVLPFILLVLFALSRGSFWAIAVLAGVTLLAETWYSFRYRIP